MIHLVTGGARSGKSTFVLSESERLSLEGNIVFIATAQGFDEDLRERIARHKEERGPRFITIEEPFSLADALRRARELQPVGIVVDCLTVWMGNLLVGKNHSEAHWPAPSVLDASITEFLAALQEPGPPVLLVTNEVGMGIVPDNALARYYRDALGRLNQRVATVADRVTLVVCGIGVRIKGVPE